MSLENEIMADKTDGPSIMEERSTDRFGDLVLQKMHSYYHEGEFCDFKIKVESKEYQVHRLVMASSSDYFRAMLSHDMLETKNDSTELKGITAKGLEPLIQYAYTGSMGLSHDNIPDVMSAASFLQMALAVDLCIDYLKERLTFDNAEEVLSIAELFSIPSLKEYYRNYILKNFLDYAKTDSFLRLDAESLIDYLSDNALRTTSESILLHNALKWYNHDSKNRDKDIVRVLEQIRYTIDGWPLTTFAQTTEPFLSNKKCMELIENAEDCLQSPEKQYLRDSHRFHVRYTQKLLVQFGGVVRHSGMEYDDFDHMGLPVTGDEFRGWNKNNFFHPNLKVWFPLGQCVGSTDEPRSHIATVEVNDCVIMTGGYVYSISEDGHTERETTRDVKLFTPHGSTPCMWDMPSLLHPRARHGSVYLSGYIYAIGGKDEKKTLSSVERLDGELQKWEYVKQLPVVLYDHAAAACKGKIYVTGGVDRLQGKKTVWCYSPDKNKWQKRADMNHARAAHGMVSFNSKLYVCGGYNSASSFNPQCLQKTEVYDPTTNQWTRVQSLLQGLAHFEMLVFNEKILVVGGVDTSGELQDHIYEYDTQLDRWKDYDDKLKLPRPLKNLSCCAMKVKVTETGHGEDETDEVYEEYKRLWDVDAGFEMYEDPGSDFYVDDYSD